MPTLPVTAAPPGRPNSGPLVEFAYRSLVDLVASRQLAPGDQIQEAALSLALGISRTPIREAIGRLLSQELLVRPGRRGTKGWLLRHRDPQEEAEIRVILHALDPLAATLAMPIITRTELAYLSALIDAMKAPTSEVSDVAAGCALFHDAVARATRNRSLQRICTNLTLLLRVVANPCAIPDPFAVAHDHAELLGTMRAHSLDAISTTFARHRRVA
jgi:DNA-binding GntR family transcriptional regulator